MKKIISHLSLFAVMTILAVGLFGTGTGKAHASGKDKVRFGNLEEPVKKSPGSFLLDHYDNRGSDVTGGPDFDDSAEVIFKGKIKGIGKVTVEASAAWTFNTFLASGGGTLKAGPCALVYDSARTLVRIHKHQGVSTENVTAPLTLIPGTEFPFSILGVGAGTLIVGTHTFTADFTVTKKNGDTITGIVEGGTNCEVDVFTTVGGHPPIGVFDFTHDDTENLVQLALEITGGTGKFADATGTGTLVFLYNTFEPHALLHAHIVLDLDDDGDDDDD